MSKTETALWFALNAAKNVIDWYETEGERSQYDDGDVPDDLCEAEAEYQRAMRVLREVEKSQPAKAGAKARSRR